MGKNPAQKAKELEAKEAAKKVEGRTAKKKAVKTPKKTIKTEAADDTARKCQIDKCKREYRAKGYCRVHYKKWRRGAYGRARFTTCYDHGCFKPAVMNRHGYCEDHFQSYYVKGVAVQKAPAAEPAKTEKKEAAA